MARRLLAALFLWGVAATGCANDGTELRAPEADDEVPSAAPEQPGAGFEAQTSQADFVLAATAFDDGGPIPAEHTCDGPGTSPELTWDGVPLGAAELAITVNDPDAGFFTHWVVAGLPPTSTGVGVDELPPGTVESLNDFGEPGWAGPCPPENHRYVFTLHALPEPLGLARDLDASEATELVESATIQAVSITGTYGPAGP